MKKLILIFVVFFVLGCSKYKYESEIGIILNLTSVKIEDKTLYDEFGGMGEGYSIEEYVLASSNINSFLSNSNKKLPKKDEYLIKDWAKLTYDSLQNEVFTIALGYSSGNEKIRDKLKSIKEEMQSSSDLYYSYYCKPEIEQPQSIELFIINTTTKKLYVFDVSI